MSRLNQLLKAEKLTRTHHQPPTSKQIEYAIALGIDTTKTPTFSALSVVIEEAKESRFAALCEEYNELDKDLQRSGDILSIAEGLTTLKKDGNGWYSGPCPKCGGVDRFYINTKDNKFKCGHKMGGNGCGWSGGLANLAAHAFHCSTWDAIDSLIGHSPRKTKTIRIRKNTKAPIAPIKPIQAPNPVHDFSVAAITSQKRLRGPDGQVGRDYLAQRGITPETWKANLVGLIWDKYRGPTICFPHELVIDGKLQIVSLNRRFLDDEVRKAKIKAALERGEKKTNISKTKHMTGGRWGLFRLATTEGARVLIVVEGETNGLSIWQVVRLNRWLIDVISVGSEGAFEKLNGDIEEIAKAYDKLVVWADNAKIGDDASRLINHHAPIKVIISPKSQKIRDENGNPKELDANDLLQLNGLSGFLSRVLPTMSTMPNSFLETSTPNGVTRHQLTIPNSHDHQPAPYTSSHQQTNGQTPTIMNHQPNGHQPTSRFPPLTSHQPDGKKGQMGHCTPTAAIISASRAEVPTANEYEDDTSDDCHLAERRVVISTWWADLEKQAETEPEQPIIIITNDDFLGLCAELLVSTDRRLAHEWYDHVENHYMYGDYTSLSEVYDAIYAAVTDGTPPVFPELPPPRPNYDDLPVIAKDDPFHRWVFAAWSVQAGCLEYFEEALSWAGKIEDSETRERALRETSELVNDSDYQLALF